MENKINLNIVSESVKKLNSITNNRISFIYVYDEKRNWVDIIHNVSEKISNDNDFSFKVGKIIKNDLIDKGIKHFSIYEDLQLFNSHTVSIKYDKKYSWEIGEIVKKLNFDFKLSSSEKELKKDKHEFNIKVA